MAAEGINRIKPGAPDLAPVTADYFWRERGGWREHVRRSDGFVVNRERLNREAVQMKAEAEERAAGLVGQRSKSFEIISLAGQHAVTQAVMVRVRCLKCAAELGPFPAYEVTSGRKKGHRGCAKAAPATPGTRRKGKPGKRRKAASENSNGHKPPAVLAVPSTTDAVLKAFGGIITALRPIDAADRPKVIRAALEMLGD